MTRVRAGVCAAVFAAAAGLAAMSAQAAAPTRGSTPEPAIIDHLLEAAREADANRCERSLPITRKVLRRSEFDGLDERLKTITFELGARCAMELKLWEEAHELLGRGVATAQPSDWQLVLNVLIASDLGRHEAVVEGFERMVDVRPALARQIHWESLGLIFSKMHGAPGGGASLRLRLFTALERVGYQPPDAFESDGDVRAEAARLRLEAGDREGAARAVAGLRDIDVLVDLSTDGRFDDLITQDLAALAAAQVPALRGAVAAHPQRLMGVVRLSKALRLLSRQTEALALLDEAVARGVGTFVDAERVEPWFWNERAYALRDHGRFDEAVDSLRKGAYVGDGPSENGAQAINAAALLNNLGRHEEALQILAEIGDDTLAEFGEAWIAAERACAFARLYRGPELAQQYAVLEALEHVNPAAHAAARHCARDMDGAAAVLIRRIGRSDQRATALASLSRFAETPHPSETDLELERQRAALRERADVRAAIEAVGGRTLTLPFRRIYWGPI